MRWKSVVWSLSTTTRINGRHCCREYCGTFNVRVVRAIVSELSFCERSFASIQIDKREPERNPTAINNAIAVGCAISWRNRQQRLPKLCPLRNCGWCRSTSG
jgi:hypothetical protein